MLSTLQHPQERQQYAYPGGMSLAYENQYTHGQSSQMQRPQAHHSFNAYASPNETTFAQPSENYTRGTEGQQQNGYPMYQSHSNSSYTSSSPRGELPPTLSGSASVPSIQSNNSSTAGSPYLAHGRQLSNEPTFCAGPAGFNLSPAIVNTEEFSLSNFNGTSGQETEQGYELAMAGKVDRMSVDPSLIQPNTPFNDQILYPNHALFQQPQQLHHPLFTMSQGEQPSTSHGDASSQYATSMAPEMAAQMTYLGFQTDPYAERRSSIASLHSMPSQQHSPMSGTDYDYENHEEKGRCPHPECGKVFKDLKAHMLTHMAERPEKCPIPTCEYSSKGFARKYDKNRHTLTHYKGMMACGFCPGSEGKPFNRADVFKRHLLQVHGVEQTPPNSRKRGPGSVNKNATQHGADLSGKCPTCSSMFSNAQDLFEHVDDCVMRLVKHIAPSEAINQRNLAEYATDEGMQVTSDDNRSANRGSSRRTENELGEDDTDEELEEDEGDEAGLGVKLASRSRSMASRPKSVLGARVSKPSRSERNGLTFSHGGVPLPGRGQSKRKNFPPDWGMPAEEMTMKKRVMCVFEGKRRLGKDDLMMKNEYQVHMASLDGQTSVSDLDVETMKRSEALHGATAEEQGPWNPNGPVPEYSMGDLA